MDGARATATDRPHAAKSSNINHIATLQSGLTFTQAAMIRGGTSSSCLLGSQEGQVHSPSTLQQRCVISHLTHMHKIQIFINKQVYLCIISCCTHITST